MTMTLTPRMSLPAKREFEFVVRVDDPDELPAKILEQIRPLGFKQAHVTKTNWRPVAAERVNGTVAMSWWSVEIEGWGS